MSGIRRPGEVPSSPNQPHVHRAGKPSQALSSLASGIKNVMRRITLPNYGIRHYSGTSKQPYFDQEVANIARKPLRDAGAVFKARRNTSASTGSGLRPTPSAEVKKCAERVGAVVASRAFPRVGEHQLTRVTKPNKAQKAIGAVARYALRGMPKL